MNKEITLVFLFVAALLMAGILVQGEEKRVEVDEFITLSPNSSPSIPYPEGTYEDWTVPAEKGEIITVKVSQENTTKVELWVSTDWVSVLFGDYTKRSLESKTLVGNEDSYTFSINENQIYGVVLTNSLTNLESNSIHIIITVGKPSPSVPVVTYVVAIAIALISIIGVYFLYRRKRFSFFKYKKVGG